MRLLILLIALTVVGLLVARQLQQPVHHAPSGTKASAAGASQAPRSAQDLSALKKSVNKMVTGASQREREEIRKETK